MPDDFDLVVLGGGPGGYAAGLYGASAGMSIAIVEEQRVGGTCLHRGCIPAKELLQTAEVLHDDVRRIICPDKLTTKSWLGASR
jgi:pyruvate/2-oxoglutarate dehydrogenase complex dihydrolipoamide dehydrogenase (E3) component